ncbi:hypothetical protein [Georgenia deserti]|uniref:Uncharacterized protein n=1 Tax=Georgenia deserti TaxID=2093781 RepID=A0ABW4L9U7_9MICO
MNKERATSEHREAEEVHGITRVSTSGTILIVVVRVGDVGEDEPGERDRNDVTPDEGGDHHHSDRDLEHHGVMEEVLVDGPVRPGGKTDRVETAPGPDADHRCGADQHADDDDSMARPTRACSGQATFIIALVVHRHVESILPGVVRGPVA